MVARRDITRMLEESALFGSLEPSVRDAVAGAMREVQFEAGQMIFARDDQGSEIFLLVQGRVRISVMKSTGRELSFAHVLPGEVFGEIAALDGLCRSAEAIALTESTLMLLPGRSLQNLLDTNPPFARAAIRFLCARLRKASDHLEDIALLPIEGRLARYLLDELSHGEPAGQTGTRRMVLGISQSELALLLGAARSKVSAALVSLEHAGAIERKGRDLHCNPALLAEIAQRE